MRIIYFPLLMAFTSCYENGWRSISISIQILTWLAPKSMYRLPMTSNQSSKAIGRLKPAVVVNLLLATTK